MTPASGAVLDARLKPVVLPERAHLRPDLLRASASCSASARCRARSIVERADRLRRDAPGRRRPAPRRACAAARPGTSIALMRAVRLLVARVARQLGQVGRHFQRRGRVLGVDGSRLLSPVSCLDRRAGRQDGEADKRGANVDGRGKGHVWFLHRGTARPPCAAVQRGSAQATCGRAARATSARSQQAGVGSAASTTARPGSPSGVIGSRSAAPQRPSRSSAHLVGAGLGSTNSACAVSAGAGGSRVASRRVPATRRDAQRVHRARRDVGGDADVAVAAEQHQRDRRCRRRPNRSRSPAARA